MFIEQKQDSCLLHWIAEPFEVESADLLLTVVLFA